MSGQRGEQGPRVRFGGKQPQKPAEPSPKAHTGMDADKLEASQGQAAPGPLAPSQSRPSEGTLPSHDGRGVQEPQVEPIKETVVTPAGQGIGKSLQQTRDRTFAVDATLASYRDVCFPERGGGTLSPMVSFTRQLESALVNDVQEKCGLLPTRIGPGAEQTRGALAVISALDGFKRNESRDAVLGLPVAVFLDHFGKALEARKRELTGQPNVARVSILAEQLKVQDGSCRMVDPKTGAVPPVYALRVPDSGTGNMVTYGITWSRGVQRELRILAPDGNLKSPVEVGLDEMEGCRGVIRSQAVEALQSRGVEFLTKPVVPRDLLAGTPLEAQDGTRVLLGGLLTEAFDATLDDPVMSKTLATAPAGGTAELVRRADEINAATLVMCARLNRATLDELDRAKSGGFVDPVAQVVEALRSSIMPMARNEQLSDLAKEVTQSILDATEGAKRYGAEPIDSIRAELRYEVDKIADRGQGDVFESIVKVMTLALDKADERRSREGSDKNYGSDLAIIFNRSACLSSALGDVRSVLREIGLDEQRMAAYNAGAIFDMTLDTAVASNPDSPIERQFRRSYHAMKILVHGNVKTSPEDDKEPDPYESEHPLFAATNKVMARSEGLVQRCHTVAAAEGMLADAFLIEAAGGYLDGMNEGNGASAEQLNNLQTMTRIVMYDVITKGTSPVDESQQAWYRVIRDRMEALGIPRNEKDYAALVTQKMTNPRAKAMVQRSIMTQALVGSLYGAMIAEGRAPGYPIRLGKVAATMKIAQETPSKVPDVPHYMSNPSAVVRIFQLKGEDGKPSGHYGKLVGKPLPTGAMDWSWGGVLKRPRNEVPNEVHKAALARQRVEILHASVDVKVPVDAIDSLSQEDMNGLVKNVSRQFSDVPLAHGGYVGHAAIDGGEMLDQLGIYVPSGVVRLANINRGSTFIRRDKDGSPKVELDLVPIDKRSGGFQVIRGQVASPKTMAFTSKEALAAELEERVQAALGGGADAELETRLRAVANEVMRSCEPLFDTKVLSGPVLVAMPSSSGKQKPCAMLISPITGRYKKGISLVSDPDACTSAYAHLSRGLAAVGASVEGYETR